MAENAAEKTRESVDTGYRSESRRILATLLRLLGDFYLAEDRCTTHSRQRWSDGRKRVCPRIQVPGSFRPAGSRPLTRYAGSDLRVRLAVIFHNCIIAQNDVSGWGKNAAAAIPKRIEVLRNW
jgi:hypothetical protein